MSEGLWEQLKEPDRERLLAAVAAAMARAGVGPWALDPAELAAATGLSVRRMRGLLSEPRAVLDGVLELAERRAGPALRAAYEAEPRWLDGVRAATLALLDFVEREPELGRLLALYGTGCGEPAPALRGGALAVLARRLDAGRPERRTPRGRPLPGAATVALGGAAAVLREGVLAGRPPVELFGPIVAAVVLPYLGIPAATRELSRPAPRPRTAPDGERTWDGPGVRLPYRTRRVLEEIRSYPGASNREVAERAGITDQGQASKLLSRLRARGLIENTGERRARGAPNSWRLSERGERMLMG